MAVFSTAQRLQQLGVATPLAQEMGKQIDSGVYNIFRLIEVGMVPGLAKIVVTLPFNGVKAMQLGMVGPVAALIGTAWASSYAPYPAPAGFQWVFVYEATEGTERVDETLGDPEIELVAA